MSRRDNVELRCPRCRMHQPICVCSEAPQLATRTHLLLVIHRNEARKPTNTGQLALQCLPNSSMVVRGIEGEAPPVFVPDAERQPLLLFPDASAKPIGSYAGGRPVTLIVPDGNWRQAGKVRQRMVGVAEVPCVTLDDDVPTTYRLRQETRQHGLATLEAIARALGVLEGAHVRAELERVFNLMVERTLKLRGARFRGESSFPAD